MKSADDLKARLGAHMKESMGGPRPSGAAGPLPAPGAFHGETARAQGIARIKDAFAIELDRIAPDPDQPRKEFDPDALAELAASLKARGQLQPIRVRWDEGLARWVIISGERRYRAALLAGLPTLACIEARGPLTPDDVLEDQLVENCLREDLKPVEQARAFKALIERRGWSYRQLGETLNIAPASIARALALLDLPADVQGQVEAGTLAPSVAYEVSKIDDPAAQRSVAGRIVAEDLSRAEAIEAVREVSGPIRVRSKGRGAKAKPRKVTSRTLRTSAGCKVTVEHRRGVDDAMLLAALREAVVEAEVEAKGRGEAAA
jgi:ParB family transcriptional regulator, chromosome partitioning protein